jgi:hypothetical protein
MNNINNQYITSETLCHYPEVLVDKLFPKPVIQVFKAGSKREKGESYENRNYKYLYNFVLDGDKADYAQGHIRADDVLYFEVSGSHIGSISMENLKIHAIRNHRRHTVLYFTVYFSCIHTRAIYKLHYEEHDHEIDHSCSDYDWLYASKVTDKREMPKQSKHLTFYNTELPNNKD